jgi:hypothetical protein
MSRAESPPQRRRRLTGFASRIGIGVRMPFALAVAVGSLFALSAPAAQAITVEKFFAGNCSSEKCGNKTGSEVEEPSTPGAAEPEAFQQASGYVPFGVTDFKLKGVKVEVPTVTEGEIEVPEGFFEGGSARFLRTDVAPGVVTNPFAAPQCSEAAFGRQVTAEEGPAKPATYTPPACAPSTVLGLNIVKTVVKNGGGKLIDAKLFGKVYNLEPRNKLSSTYGVAIFTGLEPELNPGGEPGVKTKLYTHTIIEGNVEWATDYHDYFEIHNIPVGLLESRLVFYGNHEVKKFTTEGEPLIISEPVFGSPTTLVRNPSRCAPAGPLTTNSIIAVSDLGQEAHRSFTSPIGANECGEESPFAPAMAFKVTPANALSDQPDGITAELSATHPTAASEEPDVSDLRTATLTLPPGMTMNPSASAGLQGCTPEQIGIGTRHAVACPPGSKIGTINLEVPTLPAGSLSGPIFLGKPAAGPIENPPYTIYLDAESARYGVTVRLKGTVTPNLETGQLTTTFAENPEAPFSTVALHFNTGPTAPLANPLTCGEVSPLIALSPFSGFPASFTPPAKPFKIEGCASTPPPFAAPGLSQSLSVQPPTAGASSSMTTTITRNEGQQYLTQIKTTLPPGLVGIIPGVTQCTEAQATAGACPSASQVGTVAVKSGSGEPFTFNGTVYLTEKYAGAPYGLLFKVPAVAGPFNLGNINTRAKIEVDPITAQVSVSGTFPTIVRGVPTRIREVSININRQGYLRNPTNCGALTSTSSLLGTPTLPAIAGGSATISSPFQVEGCGSLAFKPNFAASTSSKTSRQNGASLKVTIGQQGSEEANIASVVTTQPFALPSRLSTLQKACTEGQAGPKLVNILTCPETSKVGEVTAVTPTLPGTMKGPAIIVSHGGEAFPDLDLVLEGAGVRVILVGNTRIKSGITTTTFAANPDVPIKSFSLNLPTGPHSLLSANGSLCTKPLVMPTTITGQNGKKVVQQTKISVSGCLPITRAKVKGRKVTVSVKIPQAGRVRFSGDDLGIKTLLVHKARTVTVTLPVTPSGHFYLRHHNTLKTEVRVGFIPKLKGGASFTSFAKVTFH